MKYPPHIASLVDFFKKLPGVGQRSAERFAFQMLDWPTEQLEAFGKHLIKTPNQIHYCSICGALEEKHDCSFCQDTSRIHHQLCVVAYAKDIFPIEESHSFSGVYHVLGGVLSPSTGLNSEKLKVESLKNRLKNSSISELILAFDSTIEGDATTLFLKKSLSSFQIPISRLAFGMPVGSSLEYIDGSTLARALMGRQGF